MACIAAKYKNNSGRNILTKAWAKLGSTFLLSRLCEILHFSWCDVLLVLWCRSRCYNLNPLKLLMWESFIKFVFLFMTCTSNPDMLMEKQKPGDTKEQNRIKLSSGYKSTENRVYHSVIIQHCALGLSETPHHMNIQWCKLLLCPPFLQKSCTKVFEVWILSRFC